MSIFTFVFIFVIILTPEMDKAMKKNPDFKGCVECTQGWSNFQNLTKEDLERINEHRYEAIFEPGETIFKTGTPLSNGVFLVNGMAKVYLEGNGGKKLILSIAKPSRLLAGPGTYTDLRHYYTVVALTEVKTCFIDIHILKEFTRKNSKFAEGWLSDITSKAKNLFDRMISLTQKKMHGRLADALLYLSEKIYGTDDFEIHLNRQELGELANMAKESVIRILKEFAQDEIIYENCPHIRILDKEKLKKISETG